MKARRAKWQRGDEEDEANVDMIIFDGKMRRVTRKGSLPSPISFRMLYSSTHPFTNTYSHPNSMHGLYGTMT